MGEGETIDQTPEGERQMADVERIIGDPAKMAARMKAFQESVALLSSQSTRLVERYPDE
ncbi:MAG: hypothetical protein OXI33_12845 [Chloroflexota bacterium]|nr:hypothetical protein [Chloroflexota bacterium]